MRKAYQNYIFDLYGTLVDIHTDEDSPQLWASFALYLACLDCPLKKPSPAFFDLLWEFGLEPKESIMIGNDDLCDCRGASQAGMDSIYIKTEQSPNPDILLPGNCKQIAALSGLLDDIV